MNRLALSLRVRSLTRDFSSAIFREQDVIDYLNEGLDRIRQVVPELDGLADLMTNEDIPALLPKRYRHLLALYSASRCFGQDERHYQSSNFMNEFEQKLDEMKIAIENGQITIVDPVTGLPVVVDETHATGYVVNNYFANKNGLVDFDDGVEGV